MAQPQMKPEAVQGSSSIRGVAPRGAAPRKQTKTKATAAAGGTSVATVRGRPKRNLIGDADRIISDFRASTPDDISFFGITAKTTTQWMQRLVEAIDEAVAELDDAEANLEFIMRKKSIEAILAMCRCARKGGVEGEAFLSCVVRL